MMKVEIGRAVVLFALNTGVYSVGNLRQNYGQNDVKPDLLRTKSIFNKKDGLTVYRTSLKSRFLFLRWK